MSTFDNTKFTEKVAALYAKQLTERLPGVKFQIVQKGATDWAKIDALQLLGQYTGVPRVIALDDDMRNDGSIDEETAANNISSVLSEEIIAYAGTELESGGAQLWLLHENLRLPDTFGCALVHIAKPSGVQFLGQTWYDANELKTKYLAKAVWVLARSNEAKK